MPIAILMPLVIGNNYKRKKKGAISSNSLEPPILQYMKPCKQ